MSINQRLMLAVTIAALGACATAPPPPAPKPDLTPRLTPLNADTKASFECSGALPAVHRQICASDALALQDKELAGYLRKRIDQLDLPGALVLEANQAQWLLSRAGQCGLGVDTGTGVSADSNAIACLQSMYRQREAQLKAWPAPQPQAQRERHAWSTYAEFRVAEDRSSGLCSTIVNGLNQAMARDGRISMAALPGAELKAGSHAPVSSADIGGQQISVELYDAGLYAGYQQRARGLRINGQVVMDDRMLPRWVAEQPNYGGRAHASSSQTGDYGSIDVFTYRGQTLALVNETWGFYSPAARGESAYAGIYSLQGGVTPQCLLQAYLTPPRTNTLRGLSSYSALDAELNKLAGDPLPGYSQQERRDLHQRWKERQWTLLNLPLLGVDQLQRNGREAAIRARHDAAMDEFFEWSERNIGAKQLYRRVMPMLQPAHQELVSMFAAQGLNAQEAASAADLLFHETFARAMENLEAPVQAPAAPPAPFASYRPRYAIAPQAGALEQGRQFATLHSVLLNGAPLSVISDFVDYETEVLGSQRGLGADGDTALMAAVENPDAIAFLLQRGFAVDASNAWGKTALMSAAQADKPASARLLLNAGANVHAQTKRTPGAGVGGPDRREAESTRQTALLIAAGEAGKGMIDTLVDAGAARQAWSGYDQQICQQLEKNPQLDSAQRQSYRSSDLCKAAYAPVPVSAQKLVDIRGGDEMTIRDDGTQYAIRLLTRPAMTLFGRPAELAPSEMAEEVGRLAVSVVMTTRRKAGAKITGPLNLAFENLADNTPTLLKPLVSYPVEGSITSVAGYRVVQRPQERVLSLHYQPDTQTVEGAWRALYSAAYTQGLKPSGAGYVVIDNRGGRRFDYQLVVTDIYTEQ
ncbi:MAG: ankyrin repeat domain-containing protein [Halopseudomonas sp.]|uniref:ankyrin repeat domain-containing protein n=1 Tax=Halopseudomonas sp. TaxID=2901191 RepID=UPI003001AD38